MATVVQSTVIGGNPSDVNLQWYQLATQATFCANVAVFDASAGTMTVVARLGSTGAITAVVAAADLHLSFDVETGVY